MIKVLYEEFMPRKPIIRSNQYYYHLVAQTNNKDFFGLRMEIVWAIMTSKLSSLQKEYDLKIAAFVLMNNHFHLLMLTPKENIDRVMYFFMKDTTKMMQSKLGRVNRIYSGRYKGCLIEKQNYLLNAYKYVYQNPLRAGIAKRAEDYAYSTLNSNSTRHNLKIEEIVPLTLQSKNRILESRWINETFTQVEASSIKKGLSRTKFTYSKEKSARKEIRPPWPN